MFSHLVGRMPIVGRLAPYAFVLAALTSDARSQDIFAPQNAASSEYGQQIGQEQPAFPPANQQVATPNLQFANDTAVHRVQNANERMEMVANSSRVITLGQNIPRAQVNNREVLELTPLSPNEIQVFAKKAGVTQINLWNDKGQLYTIDCTVLGDARELAELIQTEFPNARIRIRPLGSSVWLTGYIDQANDVNHIIDLAKDYYPAVKSNIQVVGVQQIMLKVKVAEVSRTSLRQLGVDFASISEQGSFLFATGGGVVSASQFFRDGLGAPMEDTMRFGIATESNRFLGFIDALRRDNLIKIMAEPNLVTISGRPAKFEAGVQVPYPSQTSINGVSVDWKQTGVIVDFLPLVLGNGNLHLEARPVVREIDESRTIEISPGVFAPAFTERSVDTAVEMKPGQTLALAGLVSERQEFRRSGIPWLMEMPYIGVPFRRTKGETHEIELLILVTPELVAPLDPCEVPQCLPGMHTDAPNDCEMYMKGYIEVPSKGPCGPNGCPPPGVEPVNYQGAPGQQLPPAQYQGPPPAYEAIPPGQQAPTAPQHRVPPPNGAQRGQPPVATARHERATAHPQQPSNYNTGNRYHSNVPQSPAPAHGTNSNAAGPGFIGPVGYDVKN